MSKFKAKVGKKVLISTNASDLVMAHSRYDGTTGTIAQASYMTKELSPEYHNWVQVMFDDGKTAWYSPNLLMAAVKVAKPKLAKPKTAKPKVVTPKLPKLRRMALSSAIGLYPQTRKVLAHLETKGTISPLEAFGVYGITRLAARINEIRQAGVGVITEMRKDAKGTRYASYALNA